MWQEELEEEWQSSGKEEKVTSVMLSRWRNWMMKEIIREECISRL